VRQNLAVSLSVVYVLLSSCGPPARPSDGQAREVVDQIL